MLSIYWTRTEVIIEKTSKIWTWSRKGNICPNSECKEMAQIEELRWRKIKVDQKEKDGVVGDLKKEGKIREEVLPQSMNGGSYWLTRILFLCVLGFIFMIALLVNQIILKIFSSFLWADFWSLSAISLQGFWNTWVCYRILGQRKGSVNKSQSQTTGFISF